MEPVNERFIEIAQDLKNKGIALNDTELGALLGISKSGVSDIRNGRKTPSVGILRALQDRLMVSIEYLNTGNGPKYSLPTFDKVDKDILIQANLRTILYQIADLKAHVFDRDVNDVIIEVGKDNIEAVQQIIAVANRK